MATCSPIPSEPSLEEILSRDGLRLTDLDRVCPREIRDDIAIELGADWEMIGHFLKFSWDELRDINRENSSQEMCRVALLDAWNKREGKGATFLKLAGALHRQKRRDIVELLCTKLKSTLSLVPVSRSVTSWDMSSAGNNQQCQVLQQSLSLSSTVFPHDVSKRIETLEEQFDSLHDRLVTELSEGGASVEKVLWALTKLPLAFRREYESAIQSMLPDLEKREVIRNLFHRLNPLFTFIDYKLLQHLVSKLGSPTLKKDMTSYAEQVQLFKKVTTISELIDYWPGLDIPQIDHKVLRKMFDDDPKSYTLEKLDSVRNHFYSMMRLSEFVAVSILALLKPTNSFIAMWLIPTVVVPEILEAFGQMDSTFFQTERVLEISLDERILYQRSVSSENMTSSVMRPLSTYTSTVEPLYSGHHWDQGKVTQRKVYFHIQDKQEVRVKEACTEEAAKLPRIRNPHSEAYYKTECTYQGQAPTPNDEGGYCICSSESEKINQNLRKLLAAVSKESSVEGITFQARFGSMYFVLPRWNNMEIVSTQYLQQKEVQKKFLFRIPIDIQEFIQRSGCSLVCTIDRYKVKFKYYTDEGSLVEAASHIEEKDGTFRHVWTRVKLDVSETEDDWQDVTELVNDIVRPGRYVDIRIVSLLQRACCTPDDAVCGIAEKIAKSMTYTSCGHLSMQVSGEDYCLDFIRKKTMKYHTYTWTHPDGRNQDWTIIECYANNAKNMKLEYLRLRRSKQFDPVIVEFVSDQINEIYFNGSTHVARLNDDPKIKVSTPDEFVSNFHEFVGASFKLADLLEDTYTSAAR